MVWLFLGGFVAGGFTVAFFGASTIGTIEEDARNNRKRYGYSYEDVLREWNRGRLGEPPVPPRPE